jgi:hypothetical protein
MWDVLASFGIWIAGLPDVALYATSIALACGSIWYGATLYLRLRERRAGSLVSSRAATWILTYIAAITLCMTLLLASSIAVTTGSRHDAAVQALPKIRQEMLVFGFKVTPVLWYFIGGGILHELWKARRAES